MFFKRLTKEQIRCKYTHYALWWGIVPVYINMRNWDCPDVDTRNWIPSWTMDFIDWLTVIPVYIKTMIDPDYTPMFAIKLTGLIAEDDHLHSGTDDRAC